MYIYYSLFQIIRMVMNGQYRKLNWTSAAQWSNLADWVVPPHWVVLRQLDWNSNTQSGSPCRFPKQIVWKNVKTIQSKNGWSTYLRPKKTSHLDVCRAVQLSTRESKFNQFRKSFLNKFSSQTFYCLSIEFGRHLTKRMCINLKPTQFLL